MWILGSACLLLPALAWWWLRPAPQGKRASSLPLRTARPRIGELKRILRVTGNTTPDRFAVMLAPSMRGSRRGRGSMDFSLTIQQLVQPGSFVKKGQVVAEFDRLYVLRRLDDYRSLVLQHENNLKRLKALLAVTRSSYNQQLARAKGRMDKAALDLKKIPILSAIRAERIRLDHEEAIARYKELSRSAPFVIISESSAINASSLDLRQMRMEFDRAQRSAERMVVKSPLDGITVMLTIHRGQEHAQIRTGDLIGSSEPFMRVVDNSSMVVAANLNQVDVERVRTGMPATIHFDAFPDLQLPGRVAAVGSLAQGRGWRANFVRSIPVRLKFDKLDPRVIPDLSVSADLVVDSVENAVVVPRECVFSLGGESYAWVRKQEGWEKRPVETGLISNTEVAVVNGLQGGETLAAEPVPAATH